MVTQKTKREVIKKELPGVWYSLIMTFAPKLIDKIFDLVTQKKSNGPLFAVTAKYGHTKRRKYVASTENMIFTEDLHKAVFYLDAGAAIEKVDRWNKDAKLKKYELKVMTFYLYDSPNNTPEIIAT